MHMKRVHIYMDERLIALTDSDAESLRITRSDYIRQSVIEKLFGDKRRVGLNAPRKDDRE